MLNLAILALPLIVGILLGYALRRQKRVDLARVTFGIIVVLIFSLGFSIGSSAELLSALPGVGLNAVVILALVLLFSVVFVKAAVKLVKME